MNTTTTEKTGLFVSVNTFDADGRTIGERIVDMYHYGTRNWLQNHHWWAMHNGHCVEVTVATPEAVSAYVESSKIALANKFNSVGGVTDDPTTGAAAAAVVIEPKVAPKKAKAAAA